MLDFSCEQLGKKYRNILELRKKFGDAYSESRTDRTKARSAVAAQKELERVFAELRYLKNYRFFRKFNPDWPRHADLASAEKIELDYKLKLMAETENFHVCDDFVICEHVFKNRTGQTKKQLMAYGTPDSSSSAAFIVLTEYNAYVSWGGEKTVAAVRCKDETVTFVLRTADGRWVNANAPGKGNHVEQPILFFSESKAVGANDDFDLVVWEITADNKAIVTQKIRATAGLILLYEITPDETIAAYVEGEAGASMVFFKPDAQGKFVEQKNIVKLENDIDDFKILPSGEIYFISKSKNSVSVNNLENLISGKEQMNAPISVAPGLAEKVLPSGRIVGWEKDKDLVSGRDFLVICRLQEQFVAERRIMINPDEKFTAAETDGGFVLMHIGEKLIFLDIMEEFPKKKKLDRAVLPCLSGEHACQIGGDSRIYCADTNRTISVYSPK